MHQRLRASRAELIDWLIWLVCVAGAYFQPATDDLRLYHQWAVTTLRHGHFPTDDRWQYPPLAGPVMLVGDALPWDHTGFAVLFLAFDAAVMAMVTWHARRLGRGAGRRLWAVLPLVGGSLILTRFDVVPTAFAVAALLLASRPAASGALAALGAWIKVWPALVVAGLRRRDLPRGIIGAALTTGVVAEAVIAMTSGSTSFLGGQRGRGLQFEAVAAWPFILAGEFGAPVVIKFQNGAREVLGPNVADVARLLPLVTVALLALVAVQRLRGRLEQLPPADVALAAVLFSVVSSRVFSPQYFIWLLGLGAVALCHPTTRMRPTIALLAGAGVMANAFYPWLYRDLTTSFVPLLVLTVRGVLTVAATGTAVLVLLRAGPGSGPALPCQAEAGGAGQAASRSTG